MNHDSVKLEAEWKNALGAEFQMPYMGELRSFLQKEARAGKTIYPRGNEIFQALNTTPLSQVKVVILGQDPYHGPGQAHGLSFSVQKGVPPPPSLKNIFKELHSDLGLPIPTSGDLTPWARQGVLLLNTVLTVEQGQAASHRNQGWERFTDRVISLLNEGPPKVFLLWGSFAQSKAVLIKSPPHAILKTSHPSPLSAHAGFLGSKPFSKANAFLRQWGRPEVDWRL